MAGSVNSVTLEEKPCLACGQIFHRALRLSSQQWKARKFCSKRCAGLRRTSTDAEIVSEYVSGRSTTEIAQQHGLSGVHVARLVSRAGATRPASERQRLSHSREFVRAKLSMAAAGRPCPQSTRDALRSLNGAHSPHWISGLTLSSGGYLVFTDSPGNGAHASRALHVIIAQYKIGRLLRPGEVVHHIDHNKLNNHPDNLRVMSASEHASYHARHSMLGKQNVQIA